MSEHIESQTKSILVLFALMELLGNGVISLDEFVEYMANPPMARLQIDDLRARFDIFDKDGDGYITRDEMVEIVAELELGQDFPIEVIDSIFSEADVNDDGMISFEEFASAMQ